MWSSLRFAHHINHHVVNLLVCSKQPPPLIWFLRTVEPVSLRLNFFYIRVTIVLKIGVHGLRMEFVARQQSTIFSILHTRGY